MTRVLTLAILLATAVVVPAQDRAEDERWVCVPSENREWRCGRGANAPEPAPLPPARQPEPPPAGYRGPDQAQDVPYYLLDPTLPGPSEETGRTDGAGEQPSTEVTPGEPVAGEARPERGAVTGEGPAEGRPVEEAAPAPERATTEAPPAEERTAPGSAKDRSDARYAIQLAAARDPDSLAAYKRELELERLDVYERAWEDAAGTWHVLLTGRFATASQASRALTDLPQDIRERGAWVRPLDTLQPPSTQP